jgi:DNA-binding transcriptional LysR family regulator
MRAAEKGTRELVVDLLTNLRGFVAVADEMSVFAAADSLGIDQPLLSRRIKALEAHLHVDLLDRSRRNIGLTSAAIDLLPRARHLIEQAEHLVQTARQSHVERFSVSLPQRPAPEPLSRLIRLLAASGVEPSIRIGAAANDEPGVAVEPCGVKSATWQVRLGLAGRRAKVPAGPIHLVDMRPRRDCDPLPILVTSIDTGQPWSSRLYEAADRAGIVPSQLHHVNDIELAGALALAGLGLLVCSRAEAAAIGMNWAVIADTDAVRGYRVVETAQLPVHQAGKPRSQMLRLLADSLGVS